MACLCDVAVTVAVVDARAPASSCAASLQRGCSPAAMAACAVAAAAVAAVGAVFPLAAITP